VNQFSKGAVHNKGSGGTLDQGDTAKGLEAEALRVVRAGDEVGVILRMIGPLAARYHCPQLIYEIKSSRVCADIDLAGYAMQSTEIRQLFASLGYNEDVEINILHEDAGRLIFNHPETQLRADVFMDELNFCHPLRRERCIRGRLPQADTALERATFCHPIPWKGRLEVDNPTIPLAELVLELTQVVDLDEQDLVEAATLLAAHEIADDDADRINGAKIAELCAQQWGLWQACSTNLKNVAAFLSQSDLKDDDRAVVGARIATLLHLIDEYPKGAQWLQQGATARRTP
jgi:hypothetical protein